MAEEVKVLSVWMSTFGLRVQIALELKGIPYEYCVEDLDNKSQLLLESNPVHKMVPVLIHNGKPVCESLNIMEYIDETWKNQGPHLLPEDPYERSVARFWADLISRKVFDAVKIIWRTEGEKQKKGVEDLINLYVLLDDALGKISKGKPFFGGDEIGFLDVAFGPFVSWFHAWEIFGEFKFPGEDKCPRIPKFFQAFSSHPKVKKLLGDQRRY